MNQRGDTTTMRVGKVRIGVDVAMDWVAQYTDAEANRVSETPFAFPAYDRYDGDTDQSDKLTDADLLAPTLLNVPVKIRSYYALQTIRPQLEQALGNELLDQDLATLTVDEITDAIAPLYSVLDNAHPWGVQETTLSKVLHRNAPGRWCSTTSGYGTATSRPRRSRVCVNVPPPSTWC